MTKLPFRMITFRSLILNKTIEMCIFQFPTLFSLLLYKITIVAYRMMGHWEESFKDLTLALKLDWDPDTNTALKEVEEKVPCQ